GGSPASPELTSGRMTHPAKRSTARRTDRHHWKIERDCSLLCNGASSRRLKLQDVQTAQSRAGGGAGVSTNPAPPGEMRDTRLRATTDTARVARPPAAREQIARRHLSFTNLRPAAEIVRRVEELLT